MNTKWAKTHHRSLGSFSSGRHYLSINRIWTGPLRFRYEALDPPFEFTFPARQRWVGSVAWVF